MSSLGFQVEIIKTNRKKSASIQLKDGQVRVRAPKTLSDKRIYNLIKKRTPWIKEKLEEYSKRPRAIEKKYVDGEVFSYLGKNYRLQIIKGEDLSIKIKNGCFMTSIPEGIQNKNIMVQNLLSDWYKIHAHKYLQKRTNIFANTIGVLPLSISIKNYKSRWGSCSSVGELSFNWRIILTPHRIVDYVVIHELCHLLEHNHSPKYWRHVETYVPDWKDCRDWLRNRVIS